MRKRRTYERKLRRLARALATLDEVARDTHPRVRASRARIGVSASR